MHGFKVGILLSVTGAGREAETTYAATCHVGENVAVFIAQHYDIQRLRCGNHAPGEVINQIFLVVQLRDSTYRLGHNRAKTPIGARHDGVLGPQRDTTWIAFHLTSQCQFTGKCCHTPHLPICANPQSVGTFSVYRRSLPPCAAACQCREFRDVTLSWWVHPFEILTHNHIINTFRMKHGTAIAGVPAYGSHVDEGLLAPTQVPQHWSAGTTARSEERACGLVNGAARLIWEGRTILLYSFAPTHGMYKMNFGSQPMQNFYRWQYHLRRGVIAWNHADSGYSRCGTLSSLAHLNVPSRRIYSMMPPTATIPATKGVNGCA